MAEVFFAVTEHGSEQGEGRGCCFNQQILNDCPDHTTYAELRIFETSGDRDVEMNLAVAVFEQGHSKLYRQFG